MLNGYLEPGDVPQYCHGEGGCRYNACAVLSLPPPSSPWTLASLVIDVLEVPYSVSQFTRLPDGSYVIWPNYG